MGEEEGEQRVGGERAAAVGVFEDGVATQLVQVYIYINIEGERT